MSDAAPGLLYTLHSRPALDAPVLVVALEGWIDAGLGAAAAAQALVADLKPTSIATFDADRLLDYRARRPVMHLRDGVNTALTWPGIELHHASDHAGHDVLLLLGHEPDSMWKTFTEQVVSLASGFGTRLVVGLGAYPFAAPHTRPSRLSTTANSAELAERLGYLRNSVDVPAGVEAAIERACAEIDLSAVGLWAQVPHYAAAMPYPSASIALIEGLAQAAGLALRADSLRHAAAEHLARLDELVSQNEEHREMLRQLELQADAETAQNTAGTDLSAINPNDLPSGDDLAAEFERFLRDQG